MAAYIIDWIGGAIRIEFYGIVGTASKVAKEPDEGMEVFVARADAGHIRF
jgi:hypothetical protein